MLLLDLVKRLSVNEKAYNKIQINSDGRPLTHQQTPDNDPENVELSFVDSMIEMWKLR